MNTVSLEELQQNPEPRPFGLCAGEFTVPDDFDDSLPDDILREFEAQFG